MSEQPSSEQDLKRLNEIVAALPVDAQARVWTVYNIMHELLERDESGESELALTLVFAELANERV